MIENFRLVEIELFSYCNRKCEWCPNGTIDRHSVVAYLDRDILCKLLLKLEECNYNGAITFSRYNEPMAMIEYFKSTLKEIKNYLPNNKLITNTNGDFITYDNLTNLLIDELTIMDYDQMGFEFCKQRLLDAGAEIQWIKDNYIYATRDKIKILYYVNWQNNRKITDRGGFLKEYSKTIRTKQCFEPLYFVGVNYDGTVSPCCNIRNDIEQHKDYIIGDLHKNNLNEILNSNKAINFSKDCFNGRFTKNSPCYYCENCGGRYTSGKGGIFYE